MLVAKGMDALAAGRAAMSLLGRAVSGQSTVIAFDSAFTAIALLLVIAVPVLIAVKIGLSRYAKMRDARSPGAEKSTREASHAEFRAAA
jgi:DHA2 family multidrug resistance protein